MPISVSDARSNPADQIAHAVDVLGRATQRIAVFKAIYHGKKCAKSVNEIATTTGLDRIRVLQEGKRLADNQIVKQIRAAGMTFYEKDNFYSAHKAKILRLVQDPAAYASFPTKTRPRLTLPRDIHIRVPKAIVRVRLVTIDDIDSFSRVRSLRIEPDTRSPLEEARFKRGIARILNEQGRFVDWGGERNDLYTTRLRISGRRYAAAFAFKGRATRGILTPRHMGKNADQIQRLFQSAATVFLVQYSGQIAESVLEQMEEFAKAKSVAIADVVYFGVIDGHDSSRLIEAYPHAFAAT
jgi:hypothetical protein